MTAEHDPRDDPEAFTRLDRRPQLLGFTPGAERAAQVAEAVEEIRRGTPPWLPDDE